MVTNIIPDKHHSAVWYQEETELSLSSTEELDQVLDCYSC